MRKRLELFGFLALAATGAVACTESDTLGSGSGQLTIRLTDAPFPFNEVKSVDVHVVRIDARVADVDSAEAADDSDDGWRTLVSPDEVIDLLDLTGGKTANLGTVSLPAGTYRGFRMVIDSDESGVTLNDNSTPEVKWPSAGNNGIKIQLDEPVVIGEGTTELLIDFDVGRSFVVRGNSISQNGLLFKPVIHAVTSQGTGGLSGTIRGDSETGTALSGVTVEVLKDGTALSDTNDNRIVATTVTDGSGNYTFAFLKPGEYEVRATPPAASDYDPAMLAGGVTITAGTAATGKNIVVLK
jgi:hypothetical protein